MVWSLGEAWAYVRTGEETFARRAVATGRPLDGGWFMDAAFHAGEPIVTAGAQMLFAEEFRWQIRNEDDD